MGTDIMAQLTKPPRKMLGSHMRAPFRAPAATVLLQFPANCLGSQQMMTQVHVEDMSALMDG